MKWISALFLVGCASTPPPPEASATPTAAAPIADCDAGDAAACQAACDLGDVDRCVTAGAIALSRRDAEAAKTAFERACTGGAQVACDLVASIDSLEPPSEPCDPVDVEACALACHRGQGDSCAILGKRFLSKETAGGPDLQKAQRWFEMGCALGHTPSCDNATAMRR